MPDTLDRFTKILNEIDGEYPELPKPEPLDPPMVMAHSTGQPQTRFQLMRHDTMLGIIVLMHDQPGNQLPLDYHAALELRKGLSIFIDECEYRMEHQRRGREYFDPEEGWKRNA